MKNISFVFVIVFLFFLGLCQSCTNKEYVESGPQLKIIVKNDTNFLVKGADVSLFKTESDFLKQTNVITSMKTDSAGVCIFKDLKNDSCYFYVEFEGSSNMWSTNFVDSLASGKRLVINTILYSKETE